jgi:hypothetical protein
MGKKASIPGGRVTVGEVPLASWFTKILNLMPIRTTVARKRYWTILRYNWIFGRDNCLIRSTVMFILPNIKVMFCEIFDLGQKIVDFFLQD